MKFLVVRFSSIGDIVLTSPVIRCLRLQVETAEIHYLTKHKFSGILEANPYLSKIHTMGDEMDTDLLDRLKAEDFDYVIDLHHNIRTFRLKRALGKKAYSFPKLNLEKWLLTAWKINRMPEVHIVDRYLQTVSQFGVQTDGRGLDYFIPASAVLKPQDIPASHQAGFMALVIGAALGTKRYPIEHLMEFCKALDHPIIVLGGKEDAEVGAQLEAIDGFKIYNACGKFSLHESAGLIQMSKLVITNDTGLMHIAAAFQKPIISLWGNTVPEFGMSPYYAAGRAPYQKILEVKGLSCRPCSKIGHDSCPKKHFNCMKKIEPLVLLQAVQEFRSAL